MNIFEKSNQLSELSAELFNYRNGLYPDFITSTRTAAVPEQIPVFSFHNTSKADLLLKLQYLHTNGYATVNSSEYSYLKGVSKGERLVMLTFDDGLISLSKVVYPALKQFQMTAVAFVLPGEIDHQEENEDRKLCSWPELEEMKETVDIQSHSLFHWLVYVKPAVSAFFSPEIANRWQRIDWPIPTKGGLDRPQRDFEYGAPIYKTGSRLSSETRYFEIDSVTEACTNHVKGNGGVSYFNTKGWREKLMKIHSDAAAGLEYVVEPEQDRNASITNCIVDSKRQIESRLGKKVSGFCFPFGLGSQIGEKVAAEAGYESVYYGVKANFDYSSKVTAEGIRRVTRVKDDYLFRLPGEGRKSLFKIFYEKARRRVSFNLFKEGTVR